VRVAQSLQNLTLYVSTQQENFAKFRNVLHLKSFTRNNTVACNKFNFIKFTVITGPGWLIDATDWLKAGHFERTRKMSIIALQILSCVLCILPRPPPRGPCCAVISHFVDHRTTHYHNRFNKFACLKRTYQLLTRF
jgi:hypothetical protein